MQSEHDGSDLQVELNVEHHHDADIVPNMTRSPRVKYITYYEDSESIPGRRTAVWELDKSRWNSYIILVRFIFGYDFHIKLALSSCSKSQEHRSFPNSNAGVVAPDVA